MCLFRCTVLISHTFLFSVLMSGKIVCYRFSLSLFLSPLPLSANPLLKNHLMEAKLYWKEAGEAAYGGGGGGGCAAGGGGSDSIAARFGHAVSLLSCMGLTNT